MLQNTREEVEMQYRIFPLIYRDKPSAPYKTKIPKKQDLSGRSSTSSRGS